MFCRSELLTDHYSRYFLILNFLDVSTEKQSNKSCPFRSSASINNSILRSICISENRNSILPNNRDVPVYKLIAKIFILSEEIAIFRDCNFDHLAVSDSWVLIYYWEN